MRICKNCVIFLINYIILLRNRTQLQLGLKLWNTEKTLTQKYLLNTGKRVRHETPKPFQEKMLKIDLCTNTLFWKYIYGIPLGSAAHKRHLTYDTSTGQVYSTPA